MHQPAPKRRDTSATLAALSTLVRRAIAGSSSHDFKAQLPVQLRTERKRCVSNSA